MHVLYDARLLHRPLSGLERVQRNLLRELARHAGVDRLRAVVLAGTEVPRSLRSGIEFLPVHSTEGILAVLLGDDPPDVYHLSYFPDRHPRDLLLPVAARASVVEVHDAILNRHPEYHPDRRLWSWYHAFVKELIRTSDRLLVHSESARREIEVDLEGDPGIADVAPLAVDPDLLEPLPPAGVAARLARLGVAGEFVLAIGKDYPHKDHATLFRAAAALPGLQVVCAGSRVWHRPGETSDELSSRLGIGDRVRWIEGLVDDDVKALLQGARALVYPSHEEGFGLPPIEAMALGTPVLASRAMSIPEVCGDGALLFTPGDDAALVGLLRRVLAGGDEIGALTRRGLARAAEFSWARCADATVASYRNAVDAAHRRHRARPVLPPDLAAIYRLIAASPFDDSRELSAWQDRARHTEDHLRNVESNRAEILAQLNALQRRDGAPLTRLDPPPARQPKWSLKRRLRKIAAGLRKRR